MAKSIIHFAHANGFPAETYNKMFRLLKTDYEIGYISVHGHHPNYPVTDNWDELAQELINYIEDNYSEPVVGIGHSLGGVLTFMACVLKPALFSQFIMLDAPVLGHVRSRMLRMMKYFGLIDKITPGQATKRRRTHWESTQQAFEYFRRKAVFKHFDKDCLKDYVKYGTKKTANGVELRFDRDIELQIYRTLPHSMPKYKRRLRVPGTLIYGKHSHVIRSIDRTNMRRNFHMQSVATEGGHLFPFEFPQQTAVRIHNILCE